MEISVAAVLKELEHHREFFTRAPRTVVTKRGLRRRAMPSTLDGGPTM